MKWKVALLFCAWTMTAWRTEERVEQRRTQQPEAPGLIEAFQRGFSPNCPEEIKTALAAVEGISVSRLLGFSQYATGQSLAREAEEWETRAFHIRKYGKKGVFALALLTTWAGWGQPFKKEEGEPWMFHPLALATSAMATMLPAALMVSNYFSRRVQQKIQRSLESFERLSPDREPLYSVMLNTFEQNPSLRFSSQRLNDLILSLMRRPQGLIVE